LPKRAGAVLPPELGKFRRFAAALELEQGGPLIIEPWQLAALADYFEGVVETLILLSKKNGKTTLLAALGLYHLCSTVDAECVIGAASRDQATILYDQASGFIRRSTGLQARLAAKRGYREIRSRRDAGRIRVLAADVDTADGVIPTLALVDELHRHKSADLYGVFRDGLGPRDGQMITISTAGDHEASPLGVMRAAARRMPTLERPDGPDGRYLHARAPDDSYALHEWALEDHDDVDDLRLVKKVNPASWQTIERLAQRHDSPSMLPWQWARFACGIWIGAEAYWLKAEVWAAAAMPVTLAAGDTVCLGFDGSRYHDATALVACRLEDGLIEPLALWERPARLPAAAEWEVDGDEVDAAIADAFETYRVERMYADPPLWQTEIDEWARSYGDQVVIRFPTNRTSRMMPAVERFRTDVVAGAIPHTADPDLTRHVLNAQIREARGGYYLEKGKTAAAGYIDMAVAAVLAYGARCDLLASGWRRRSRIPVSF
jgi:phage terminase large subunit-like protein